MNYISKLVHVNTEYAVFLKKIYENSYVSKAVWAPAVEKWSSCLPCFPLCHEWYYHRV